MKSHSRIMIPVSGFAAAIACLASPAFGSTDGLGTTVAGPDTTVASTATATSPATITRTVLGNGMHIVVQQEPDAPLTAVCVLVKVGAGQETDETAGIGNFVAETLLSSTSSRTPDTIASEIADLGGNVTVSRQPDWTQISALTVPDKLGDLMALVTDVLKDATFDPDTITSQRDDILNEIDSGDASVFDHTYNNMRGALFADSGYGLPQLGTRRSVYHLDQTKLLRYYREYFIPKNLVFVVVGPVQPDAVQSMITSDMADYDPTLRGSHRPTPAQSPEPALTSDVPPVHGYIPDLAEICVMAGCRAPSMSSPDYPALQVLNALLGGMKTSRMFTNLREKQGLAYDLGSFYSPQLYSGDLTAFIFASPSRLPEVGPGQAGGPLGVIRDQLLQQFDSMKSTPPTPLDLSRAKHYLIGTYKIKHERIEDRASLLAVAELTAPDGALMDSEYARLINAVTADDVVRVARTYLIHPVISTLEPDPQNGGMINE
ncbi:MAG: M16 family metallopeptidase [Capsulimonadaceae bacterium]